MTFTPGQLIAPGDSILLLREVGAGVARAWGAEGQPRLIVLSDIEVESTGGEQQHLELAFTLDQAVAYGRLLLGAAEHAEAFRQPNDR